MIRINFLILAVVGVLLLTIAGCGGQPYIHLAKEYDRESEIFLRGITDRDDVTICYTKRKTTPRIISQMAAKECRRFGRVARLRQQTLGTCPLATPIAAVFDCLKPTYRARGNVY